MAIRARLTPPREAQRDWPWHRVKSSSLSASILFAGERRMEAENFLASGFQTRIAIESKSSNWIRLIDLARTFQPSRLKGIQVSKEFGTAFLTATQVYDVRPIPRKWLSLDRTKDHAKRFVSEGTILVTCSGNVGRATLAHSTIKDMLISHDLLRIEPNDPSWLGWIYAYFRTRTVREMIKAARYGHIIKHLETQHLDTLPIVEVDAKTRKEFWLAVKDVIEKRDRAYALTLDAERLFADAFGDVEVRDLGEKGFVVRTSEAFATPRCRLDAWYHNPSSKAITDHLSKRAIAFNSLAELGFDVWLPTRFRRVSADDGVLLLDSSDVFEISPDINKRIADKDFGDPYNGRVKQGWILLSRSGQIYGLNGSAVIAGQRHEDKVISDHIIRIAPKRPKCRGGYLLMAMTHPGLGRPRVKALPYGSSVPEIEVYDAQRFQIPRLDTQLEAEIANRVEEAAQMRDEADKLESQLADRADAVIAEFLAGN